MTECLLNLDQYSISEMCMTLHGMKQSKKKKKGRKDSVVMITTTYLWLAKIQQNDQCQNVDMI